MDNYTGKRLDGRYEIQEVIGVGGMAVVYKAYDNIDDRTVAVKILKDEFLANEEFRRRFKNESKAVSVLSHPNIVKVFNVSFGDKLQYIVMEHVEGITLKEYIEQQGKLGIKETVHFTIQILRALQHAHDKGIVHRDIKPQNIMLLSNGNIKVTDFGIARFSYSDTKTMTDSAIGSVHYISPEQARGDTTDDRADIYSVGVVLYEMLTGQLPFQSDNSVSVALMQLQTEPKLPRELNSSIPIGLEQIVMHAMQKNNKDRYQSAAEMLLDIEEFKRNPLIRFQHDYFVDSDPTKFVPRKNPSTPSQPAIKIPVSGPSQPQSPEYDEYDDSDDGRKGKGGLIAIGVAIGLLVISLFAFLFTYFFTDVFRNTSASVPNFVGMNYETQIKDNSKYSAYKFEISTISNSAYENGTVFDQEPDSGQKLDKNSNVVQLAIVQNEEKIVVPNVIGYGHELAEQTLKNKGLIVKLTPMLSLTEEFGKVIKTDPEADTEIDTGSVIIVYYASNEDLVEVPSVANVGWDVEMAEAMLKSVPLVMDPEIKEQNSNEPAGTVIAQSPEAGEKVMPNSKVSIVISNGIPESSEAEIRLNLPSSGSRGSFEVFVNNESVMNKSLLLDGSEYPFKISGSGADVSVKIYIDNKEYYTCIVDFTQNPAVVMNGSYSGSIGVPSSRKQMPSVVGMTMSRAISHLSSSGFNVNNIHIAYQTVYTDADNGVVLSQTPAATASGIMGITQTYDTNTQITLVVGQKEGL